MPLLVSLCLLAPGPSLLPALPAQANVLPFEAQIGWLLSSVDLQAPMSSRLGYSSLNNNLQGQGQGWGFIEQVEP